MNSRITYSVEIVYSTFKVPHKAVDIADSGVGGRMLGNKY